MIRKCTPYRIPPSSSRRETNGSLSSITEHSFHGISLPAKKGKSVTHASGTICYLAVGSLSYVVKSPFKISCRIPKNALGVVWIAKRGYEIQGHLHRAESMRDQK